MHIPLRERYHDFVFPEQPVDLETQPGFRCEKIFDTRTKTKAEIKRNFAKSLLSNPYARIPVAIPCIILSKKPENQAMVRLSGLHFYLDLNYLSLIQAPHVVLVSMKEYILGFRNF